MLNALGFPASNKKPVLLFMIVSFEPPMLLAIIGFSIDCASTDTLPKASGSIDETQQHLKFRMLLALNLNDQQK